MEHNVCRYAGNLPLAGDCVQFKATPGHQGDICLRTEARPSCTALGRRSTAGIRSQGSEISIRGKLCPFPLCRAAQGLQDRRCLVQFRSFEPLGEALHDRLKEWNNIPFATLVEKEFREG